MRLIVIILMLFGAALAQEDTAYASVDRAYCTQHGPFFLRFDPDKAAGVFAILPNNDLGAVVGTLTDHTLEGRWIKIDSHGPIRMTFSEDWSSFDAAYAVELNADDWITGWTGYLPPAGDPGAFDIDGEMFRCR